MSEIQEPRRRGRPVVIWKDMVKSICMKEFLIDGEDFNREGGSVFIGRGGGYPAVVIPLGNISGGNEASETIDIKIIMNNKIIIIKINKLPQILTTDGTFEVSKQSQ